MGKKDKSKKKQPRDQWSCQFIQAYTDLHKLSTTINQHLKTYRRNKIERGSDFVSVQRRAEGIFRDVRSNTRLLAHIFSNWHADYVKLGKRYVKAQSPALSMEAQRAKSLIEPMLRALAEAIREVKEE